MAARRQDEIIRLLLEIAGEEGADAMVEALRHLETQGGKTGKAAEAISAEFAKLDGELDQLARTTAKADRFEQLGASIDGTRDRLAKASTALQEINQALDATEKPTRKMLASQKAAAAEVERANSALLKQETALASLDGELREAGVDSARLADEQQRLRAQTERTVAGIRQQADAVRAQAQANAELRARLDASDDAFRRQATANRTAAEALRAYRARSDEARKATQALGAQADRSSGLLGKLRGVAAGVFAAFGIRELARGAASILGLGEAAEKTERQFARLFGGARQGNAALADLKQLAKDLGQDYEALRDSAAKLKTFGLDPLDGSLKSLIDQNTAAGGSQQDLEGKILAVGQAWAKQKLQGEEILQLVERGVPVWDLLTKATGKNVAELQKLSEAGKLGRAEIKLLLEEIGKANEGAAADAVEGLTARITRLSDQLKQVASDFAREGATDALAESLGRVSKELEELAGSPEFARLKASLTEAFREGLDAANEFLDSERFRAAAEQMATSIEGVRSVVGLLRTDVAGVHLSAVDAFLGIAEAVQKPLQMAEQLASMGFARLNAAINGTKESAAGLNAELDKTKNAEAPVSAVVETIKALGAAAQKTRDAMRDGLNAEALALVENLRKVVDEEKKARAAVAELFKTVNTQDSTALGNIALALAQIATESTGAAAAVRDSLGVELRKLSGEDLLRFKEASEASFREFGVSAEEAAIVLNETLITALERLGVEGDALGARFTQSGEDIIATFRTVATSAEATGQQIEAAFKAALSKISTSEEARALGVELEAAGKRGAIGLDSAERSAAALRARLREIHEAADPLQDAFERLGITSQRELRNAADTARDAFDQIVSGAQRGQAATEDVRRAFVAYAQAQLDAVRNAPAWERSQVETMIRVRAQALGVTEALGELGLAGARAGDQVASGADRATGALRGTEAAAEGAAAAASSLANAGSGVTVTLANIGAQAQATSADIQGVSDKFRQLLTDSNLYKGGGTQLFQDLNRQTGELEEQLRLLEEQNAAYDPLTQRVRDLRAQYELLGDEQLQRLAQAQMQFEENQRREREEVERRRREAREEIEAANRARTEGRGRTAGAAGDISSNVNIDMSGLRIFGAIDDKTAEEWIRPLKRQLDKLQGRSR